MYVFLGIFVLFGSLIAGVHSFVTSGSRWLGKVKTTSKTVGVTNAVAASSSSNAVVVKANDAANGFDQFSDLCILCNHSPHEKFPECDGSHSKCSGHCKCPCHHG
jgi:hypothetical protein